MWREYTYIMNKTVDITEQKTLFMKGFKTIHLIKINGLTDQLSLQLHRLLLQKS